MRAASRRCHNSRAIADTTPSNSYKPKHAQSVRKMEGIVIPAVSLTAKKRQKKSENMPTCK